ncbi:MAG: hypothetical protein HC905_18960 [Bacteroidales bacterium]|nr:hypothetical protein [Bacteroidales bacterium]
MSLKEILITTALLGTAKKQLSPDELPEPLKAALEGQTADDNETTFLRSASLALNYLKAGTKPLQITLPANEAPDEEKPYCSPEAMMVLKELLSNKYHHLTWFWCKHCRDKGFIVQPEMLPELFEWGVSTKKQWSTLFSEVIGKRGLWLSQFSDDWKFVTFTDEDGDWDTTTLPQRVNLLKQLRMQNPSEARIKIETVWKEENAAARQELLATLIIALSHDDEVFLNRTLNDKSQKVKELAWQLLKLIPDSAIIQKYRSILQNSIVITLGKMLGLINKTSIDIRLKLPDEEIFTTGIQNLSSDKRISDDNFILMQLISEVPPEFWTEHFNTSPGEIVKMFASRDELKKFQGSLVNSILKFKSKLWAKLVADNFNVESIQLLPLLEAGDKIKYAEHLLKVSPNIAEIVNALRNEEHPVEWNNNLSRQLISVMAQDPYAYANLFEGIAVYLPATIVNDLDRFFPSEEWKRNYWQKTSQQIREYLQLKEKIKAIF